MSSGCRPEAAAAAPCRCWSAARPAGSRSCGASASTCSGIRASARRPARRRAPSSRASRAARTRLDASAHRGLRAARSGRHRPLQLLAGTGRSMLDWVRALAPLRGLLRRRRQPARPSAACRRARRTRPTPAACNSPARDRRRAGRRVSLALAGLPVVNIAGCAPHPGWIMETLAALALGALHGRRPRRLRTAATLRRPSRPSRLQPQRILRVQGERRRCVRARLPDGASRLQGDAGGRRLQPARLERRRLLHAGAASPASPAPRRASRRRATFITRRRSRGIPVGLPLDMPKAWFVALAALSKSATPRRVRENARADHIVAPPGRGEMTRLHRRALQPRRGRSRTDARHRGRRGARRRASRRRSIAASSNCWSDGRPTTRW